MGGPLQRDWKHGIPREAHVIEERINLTFRRILGRSPQSESVERSQHKQLPCAPGEGSLQAHQRQQPHRGIG